MMAPVAPAFRAPSHRSGRKPAPRSVPRVLRPIGLSTHPAPRGPPMRSPTGFARTLYAINIPALLNLAAQLPCKPRMPLANSSVSPPSVPARTPPSHAWNCGFLFGRLQTEVWPKFEPFRRMCQARCTDQARSLGLGAMNVPVRYSYKDWPGARVVACACAAKAKVCLRIIN